MGNVQFSRVEQHVFHTIDQIKPGFYYRPRSQRLESIDAIRLSQEAYDEKKGAFHELFQMTVAKQHGIKVKGLEDVLGKNTNKNTNKKARFYFVVPGDIFPHFTTPQNYLTSGGTKCTILPSWIDEVEQWVLKLIF